MQKSRCSVRYSSTRDITTTRTPNVDSPTPLPICPTAFITKGLEGEDLQFDWASASANQILLQLFCKTFFVVYYSCSLNELTKEETILCPSHQCSLCYLYKHILAQSLLEDQNHPLPPKKLFGEVTQHQLYHHTVSERQLAGTAVPK